MRSRSLVLLLGAALLVSQVACSDGGLATKAKAAADGANAADLGTLPEGDAAPDVAVAPDAEADAAPGSDVAADVPAAPDAEADAVAGTDAATLADADAAPDAAPDAAADVASGDTGADAGSDTTGPQPATYGGHCTTPFTMPAKQPWVHDIASPVVILSGAPNHRIRDLILPVGTASKLRGHFTYGVIDAGLGDETVELWVRTCPGWVSWGKLQTDASGIVWFDVPANVPQGDYALKMVVLGDQTVADGAIAVWPKGVHALVTDVDGTLTTSDWELFKDVIFGASATMYPDANTMIQAWFQKDYRIIYLTGRPQLVNRYTRTWLASHDFPLGTLHLTEGLTQLPPTVDGEQKFKSDFLTGVQQATGVLLRAGYGNATTDVGAYEAVGLAKTDIWIIGTNAGYDGTQPVADYTSHLPKVATYPAAVQP